VNPRLPQAVLLDLDDTILDDSGGIERCWMEACAACADELDGVDAGALYAAVRKTRAWYWDDPERHRRGRLDLDASSREVVALSLAECGVSNTGVVAKIAQRYRLRRDEGFELFPGAVETIHWLRQCGCRLALLTNGNAATQRNKITRFGLADLFDYILIEGELGFGKPDPRVYEHALGLLDVPPAECWMVGDNLEWDVAQPQRMGIRGIWVDAGGGGVPAAKAVRPDRIVRRLSDLMIR
jgi:putative hydrolase of the HAD superfamily